MKTLCIIDIYTSKVYKKFTIFFTISTSKFIKKFMIFLLSAFPWATLLVVEPDFLGLWMVGVWERGRGEGEGGGQTGKQTFPDLGPCEMNI